MTGATAPSSYSSFPRKRESRRPQRRAKAGAGSHSGWIPAFAGMTKRSRNCCLGRSASRRLERLLLGLPGAVAPLADATLFLVAEALLAESERRVGPDEQRFRLDPVDHRAAGVFRRDAAVDHIVLG